MSDTYNVERGHKEFLRIQRTLSTNLMLKCQGLFFRAGMAYVSLAGLQHFIVSASCLTEVNRLRETFSENLSQYDLPP